MSTSFSFGINSGSITSSLLLNQSIGTLNIGDPVYFDGTLWQQSDISNQPRGIYQGGASGSATIVISGKLSVTPTIFISDRFYYMANIGGITLTRTSTKVGKSISTTELLVDIDVFSIKFKNRVAGYSVGGGISSQVAETFIFSSNSSSSIAAPPNPHRGSATFNSDVAGYITGNGTAPAHGFINRLDFSNDSWFQLSTVLGVTDGSKTAYESKVAGYIAIKESSNTTVIEKLCFATETNNQNAAFLVTTSLKNVNNGAFNSLVSGYYPGGVVPTNIEISSIERLIFSTDFNSILSTVLSIASKSRFGFESKDSGYNLFGAFTGSELPITQLDKLVFATESNSLLTSIVTSRFFGAAFNSNNKGYVAGGRTSTSPSLTRTSQIHEFDFTADLFNIASIGNLTVVDEFKSGFEN